MMDSLAEQVPRSVRHEHASQVQGRQRLSGGDGKSLRRRMKAERRDARLGHRIDGGMLAVELIQFEGLPRRGGRARDHVGDFAGDVEIAAAVVADVENEIMHPGALQLTERSHEFALGGRDVVVEEHVSDEVPPAVVMVCTFCTGVSVTGPTPSSPSAASPRPHPRSRSVWLSPLVCGTQARVQGVDACLVVGVDQIDAVHGEDLRSARKACRRDGGGGPGLGVGHDDIARRRAAMITKFAP